MGKSQLRAGQATIENETSQNEHGTTGTRDYQTIHVAKADWSRLSFAFCSAATVGDMTCAVTCFMARGIEEACTSMMLLKQADTMILVSR